MSESFLSREMSSATKLSRVEIHSESSPKGESIMRQKHKRERARPAAFLVQPFFDHPLAEMLSHMLSSMGWGSGWFNPSAAVKAASSVMMTTAYSRTLMEMRRPSLLSLRCSRVRCRISSGQATNHQNVSETEYPPPERSEASPKDWKVGSRLMRWAIGDEMGIESSLRYLAMRSISSRSDLQIRYR